MQKLLRILLIGFTFVALNVGAVAAQTGITQPPVTDGMPSCAATSPDFVDNGVCDGSAGSAPMSGDTSGILPTADDSAAPINEGRDMDVGSHRAAPIGDAEESGGPAAQHMNREINDGGFGANSGADAEKARIAAEAQAAAKAEAERLAAEAAAKAEAERLAAEAAAQAEANRLAAEAAAKAEADRLAAEAAAQAEVDSKRQCVKKKWPNGYITYWDDCLHILSKYGQDIAASWRSLRVAASERCEKVEGDYAGYVTCPDGKQRQRGYDSYMVESFCAGSEHGGLKDSDGWKMHIDDEGHVKGPPAVWHEPGRPGIRISSKTYQGEIGLARCDQTTEKKNCNC